MEIEEVISVIENQDSISIDESFSIAKITSILLRSDDEKGRKIIIYILDNWEKIPNETVEIWTDLIESAGFYPYLEKEKEKLKFNNLAGEIRKGCHLSDNIISKENQKYFFHEEQKHLKNILDSGKNLIVSAPTSFGKSLLIEEMVASKRFKNIVVIQPTLALLDETRKKLKKYQENYKIIVRTSQEPSEEKGNLFLLTAERVMEYKDLPQIDFFVIDEFYKLSAKRDDERSDILNNAFIKLLKNKKRSLKESLDLKNTPQFYLLGPNIDGISEGFEKTFNAEFYYTKYSLIENTTENIACNKNTKENLLFEKLYELKEQQTIIYCSSPTRVRSLAYKFCNYLIEKGGLKNENLPLIEWIKKEVNSNWNLIDFLSLGIGINDGALQKHINSSMIDYFNDKEKRLRYLFCTSTIIEGVNTSAKNVIFFDDKKGGKDIDFFDYSNIKGRSGRMMIHYIGKVFNFHTPPKSNEEKMIIDIPFFEQNPVKKEVIVGQEDEDLKLETKESTEYKELILIPEEERKLFHKNGVLIDGQKRILDQLKIDIQDEEKRKLILWSGFPDNQNQLKYLINLSWDNLIKWGNMKKDDFFTLDIETNLIWEKLIEFNFILNDGSKTVVFDETKKKEFILNFTFDDKQNEKIFKIMFKKKGETTRPMTKQKLVIDVWNYSFDHNINNLIESTHKYYLSIKESKFKNLTDMQIYNEAIRDVLQIMRHWFQYKVPKWLSVMNELQKYVCRINKIETTGDYSPYANQLENDFIDSKLSILAEYGIPTSAINKLSSSIDKNLSEDDILKKVKEIAKNNSSLMQYERDKIESAL